MRNRQDPTALLALLPLLVDADFAHALPARLEAETLLGRTAAHDLGWLEQRVRSCSGEDYYGALHPSARWMYLKPEDLPRLTGEPAGATVIKVASLHSSGYVRMAAVALLDSMQDGSELAFLLLRCNDWVGPVQSRAAAAVQRRLVPEYAAYFLLNTSLVDRLREQRRNDLGALYQQVQQLLRSKAGSEACQAALSSGDRYVRRAAFRLWAESPALDLRTVLLRALRSDDLWIRIWATRTARTRLYGPALREALGQARTDRGVPVRREALLGFVDQHPELRQSLLDPCSGLREMVRYYLRKKANLDFAAIYRQEVSRLAALGCQPGVGAQLATAIAGISETGTAADAEAIEIFAIDERPRVRRAALLGLGRLAPEQNLATLSAALSDPQPGAFRAALQTLGPRLVLVDDAALRRALQEQQNPRCHAELVAALSRLPQWKSARLG